MAAYQFVVLFLSTFWLHSSAFEFPFLAKPKNKLPKGFSSVQGQKKAILDAVSYTNNGKTATKEQQAKVLRLVRALEVAAPPSDELLSDANQAQILNGTWYLHYTSPSDVVLEEEDEESSGDDTTTPWTRTNVEPEIETPTTFQAQGTVSAAGITVDTSNRSVQQTINVDDGRVTNDVVTDWGRIVVGGPFRPSTRVPTRAVVAFDTCQIAVNGDGESGGGVVLNLGFLFKIAAFFRKTTDSGWLETTFVDDEMRLGRGNKGTLFVLTRDPTSVEP